MPLRVELTIKGNLATCSKDIAAKLAAAQKQAVSGYAASLKQSLRDDTLAGGLGDRIANAWLQKDYDDAGAPAALVYSKAPIIVTAFSQDTTIVPHDGHLWLAIPTANVPGFGSHPMTPVEVEARFNQDLIFLPARPGTALAFVNVVSAKSGRGFRPATKGRAAQGRKPQLVLMFVMVKQVHLRKRLDWPAIMADAQAGFEEFLGTAVATALKD